MDTRLDGKHALVTGGTRGIGREISLALVGAGATVVAVYRENADAANGLGAELGWARANHVAVKADLLDEANVAALVADFRERFGELDILVNNVGSYSRLPFDALTEDAWRQTLDTNLTLPYIVTRCFVPHLAAGASVINIGVAMALRGMPQHVHYTASKAGLIGLTRSLSKELGPRGIRVNTVAPGIIDAGDGNGAPPGLADRLRAMTSLGRFGSPEEIARVVLFLAGDLGSYVTGTTINVDGGI